MRPIEMMDRVVQLEKLQKLLKAGFNVDFKGHGLFLITTIYENLTSLQIVLLTAWLNEFGCAGLNSIIHSAVGCPSVERAKMALTFIDDSEPKSESDVDWKSLWDGYQWRLDERVYDVRQGGNYIQIIYYNSVQNLRRMKLEGPDRFKEACKWAGIGAEE